MSPSHISPRGMVGRPGRLVVAVGGGVVQLAGRRPATIARTSKRRGQVTAFSAKSRRRLMRLLRSVNQLQLQGLPVFLTLTYPAEWDGDPARWKRDLDVFLKRLGRRWPAASAVWKLEFQRRGAPHFHLLVFGVQSLPRDWVAQVWYEVVNSQDMSHLLAGTRVERVRSWRGVMSYAAKYMGKAGQAPGGQLVGRFWGVYNRAALPVTLAEAVLAFGEFYQLRRILRRYAEKQGRAVRLNQWDGLTVFLDWVTAMRLMEAYSAGVSSWSGTVLPE